MKFRKIYWVTEQLDESGLSEVAGVYTSIQDLTSRGFNWKDGIEKSAGFRLSLVQLDSSKKPLGTWSSPDFGSIESDLEPYIASDEMNAQDVEGLVKDLRART